MTKKTTLRKHSPEEFLKKLEEQLKKMEELLESGQRSNSLALRHTQVIRNVITKYLRAKQ